MCGWSFHYLVSAMRYNKRRFNNLEMVHFKASIPACR
jgi:hypothetical protein